MKAGKEISIVQTTVSSLGEAQKLAALVLRRRLGACVHLIPVTSIYRWKGKKETSSEILLSIKTRRPLAAALADLLKKNHPYELPEIIVLPVAAAGYDYAAWVYKETK